MGAGVLLAPTAHAADKWGSGYTIPDSNQRPGKSHLGAFDNRGTLLPHVTTQAYCADPTEPGPEAGGKYSAVKTFSTWTSKASGKQVSAADVHRAAYLLSRQHKTDRGAAAVDAAVYTYLNRGTSYALPNGHRALERLAYKTVPASVKNVALSYIAEANRFAGPYKVNIHAPSVIKPGTKVPVTVDVTSASGYKLPNTQLKLSGATNATVTTNLAGTARTTITAPKSGAADLQATAGHLPSTKLHAQLPSKAPAQRVVVVAGSSTAKATAHIKTASKSGSLKITKSASDTHKALAGVQFQIKDQQGKVVATGKTDVSGVLEIKNLAPGQYAVHEVRAVEGYQLSADQHASVGTLKATNVKVVDTKIPEKSGPRTHSVHLPGNVLPQTGA
ncbi:MSCRAMM family protein [Streptomyces nigrescens]|uniref:MSCRAMM family protein n=1 Tax=Streptomyces nigrescens TaxID=1920 RepID=UPI003700DE78